MVCCNKILMKFIARKNAHFKAKVYLYICRQLQNKVNYSFVLTSMVRDEN